jgi:hypothetical protein
MHFQKPKAEAGCTPHAWKRGFGIYRRYVEAI